MPQDDPTWPPPTQGPAPSWTPTGPGYQPESKSQRRWFKKKRYLIPLGLVLAIGAVPSDNEEDLATAAPAPAASVAAAPSEARVPPKIITPEEKAARAEKARLDEQRLQAAAEARRQEGERKRQEEERKRQEAAAAAEAAEAERQRQAAEAAAAKKPSSYEDIGARDFALVAKNPDQHTGKKYVLYGYVSQFDAATGDSAFRASAGADRADEWYEYDTNVLVQADSAALLANVVQDDIVKMYVVGAGDFSYDTQIGGNTTVPMFKVNMIEVIGSTKS